MRRKWTCDNSTTHTNPMTKRENWGARPFSLNYSCHTQFLARFATTHFHTHLTHNELIRGHKSRITRAPFDNPARQLNIYHFIIMVIKNENPTSVAANNCGPTLRWQRASTGPNIEKKMYRRATNTAIKLPATTAE